MNIAFTDKQAHDLRLTHAVMDYDESGVRGGASDDDVVRLHFSLQGQYGARYATLGRRFERLGPHFSLFYARPFELAVVNQTPRLETFGVRFPVARFIEYAGGMNGSVARFCERIGNGQPSFLLEPSASLPPALEHSIRRMLETRYEGALEELYLLSQSIELLVHSLELALGTGGERREPSTVKRDRDKLFAARDFVDMRLTDPPLLAEVARRSGLNELKLKRGFKQLFGTSVFGYLTTRRLELARRMLLDTDKTAAEIGFELGYATPQHFSQAFKNRFGVAPKSLRKRASQS